MGEKEYRDSVGDAGVQLVCGDVRHIISIGNSRRGEEVFNHRAGANPELIFDPAPSYNPSYVELRAMGDLGDCRGAGGRGAPRMRDSMLACFSRGRNQIS